MEDPTDTGIESIDLIIDPTDPLRRHLIKHGVGRIRSGTRMLDNKNEWYTQWDDEALPTPLMDVWLVRVSEAYDGTDHVVGIYTTHMQASCAAQKAYKEWDVKNLSNTSVLVDRYTVNRFMKEKDDQNPVLV